MTLKNSSKELLKNLLYNYIDICDGYDSFTQDQKDQVDELFKIANNFFILSKLPLSASAKASSTL